MRCGLTRSIANFGGMKQASPPQYQPPPEDPQYLALKQQADQDQINATQNQVRIDSASLLARYGALVTMANAGGASAAGASPAMTARPIGGT